VLLLPALSVAAPDDVLIASVVIVCDGAQVAIPDLESAQVKLTVTLVLFQPAAFGAGAAIAVIVGGVSSMLTVAAVLLLFPAASVRFRSPSVRCLRS